VSCILAVTSKRTCSNFLQVLFTFLIVFKVETMKKYDIKRSSFYKFTKQYEEEKKKET
jgi:hypothetical protein